MQERNDPRSPSQDGSAPRKVWSKPELVEYGHLAKLTRGPSGNMTEQGGLYKPTMCL